MEIDKHTLYNLKSFDNSDCRERNEFTLCKDLPNPTENNTMTGEIIGNSITPISVKRVGWVEVPKKFKSYVDDLGCLVINDKLAYSVRDLEREMGARITGGGNRPVVVKVPAHPDY